MRKDMLVAGLVVLGFSALWAGLSRGSAVGSPAVASVPVTIDVFSTAKEVAAPCHMKCSLSWGPHPKGSMKVVPLPLSSTDSTAITVIQVPVGQKETVTYKQTFSDNCEVEGTCLKGAMSVGQQSQTDVTSPGTCHKGYSENKIIFIGGGKVLEFK